MFDARTEAGLLSEPEYCHKCGSPIADPNAVRCPKCYAPKPKLVSKNKTLAGFLALLLGGFGVHRFYLGQWWGIFYVVFWFTLIPALIAVVEAFVFWFSSTASWQKKYAQVPKSGGVMAAIGLGAFFISTPIIGIFAAIALPAYQDYSYRVKVSSALPLVNEAQQKVAEHFSFTGRFPSGNGEAGLAENLSTEHVTSLVVSSTGDIQVTFNFPNLHNSGNNMIWSPTAQASELSWTCTGGLLADRFRPHQCRGGSGARAKSSSPDQPPLNKRIFSDDRRLSINVPSSWRANKTLNEEASLGAANLMQEGYVIVIEELREDFGEGFTLGDYTDIVMRTMKESVEEPKTPGKRRRLTINGLPAEQLVLMGRVNQYAVTYLVTTVESDNGFYQVLTWTLSSRFKDKHRQMRAIARTFIVRSQQVE